MSLPATVIQQHCRLSICEYWLSWTNTVSVSVSEQKIPITILILKRGPCLLKAVFLDQKTPVVLHSQKNPEKLTRACVRGGKGSNVKRRFLLTFLIDCMQFLEEIESYELIRRVYKCQHEISSISVV